MSVGTLAPTRHGRTWAIIGAGIAVVLIAGVLYYPQFAASRLDLTIPKVGENSIVYASDGRELFKIAATGHHVTLSAEQTSPLLDQSHLAAEDRGFYVHGGVSYPHMVLAFYRNIRTGSLAGGSTITQQYVKREYLTSEQTVRRKTQEMLYAYRIEDELGKDEILTRYENANYYGLGAYGVEDASRAWFGHSAIAIKDPANPTHVAKAALLAALLKQPSYYDERVPNQPNKLVHEQDLVDRQVYVIEGLRDLQGVDRIVTDATIEAAKQLLPLKLTITERASGTSPSADPILLSYVKDWLTAWQTELAREDATDDEEAKRVGQSTAEAMLARGGLRITLSINPELQAQMDQVVKAQLPSKDLSAGVVIMNAQTGAVLGMHSSNENANYALYANRQPGSTVKAVLLADAVRNGVSVLSEFGAPASIQFDGPPIWNHDRKAAPNCKLTLADAIAESNNIVATELLMRQMTDCSIPQTLTPIAPDYDVSPHTLAELIRQMGGQVSTVPGRTNPTKIDEAPRLAIGDTIALSPLKLAAIGATLASGGVHTKPSIVQQITTSDGTVVYEHEKESERVLETEHVNIVNQVLRGVYTTGTAQGTDLDGHPLAGKTGSTSSDAWMLAYNARDRDGDAPTYVCAAWGGYADSTRSIDGKLSSRGMARICQGILGWALRDSPRTDFPEVDVNVGTLVAAVVPEPSASPTPEPSPSEEPSPSPEPSASETTDPPPTPDVSVTAGPEPSLTPEP